MMDQGIAAEPSARTASTDRPALYTRNASGMVREVSIWDMLAYNAAAASGTGMALVIGLFFVFASFPGANIYIALPAALAVIGVVWVTFSLMSATFPRAGGDYLFGSRVIHPIVGLASHLAMFLSTVLAVGLFGAFMTNVGLAPTLTIIGVTTGHPSWVRAAETISQRGWMLAIGIAAIVLISLLSMLRTKLVARLMTWSLGIATLGFLIAFVVMLFTSNDSFVHTVNSFSEPYTHTKDTYGQTIAAGARSGLQYPSEHGYSFKGTLGAFEVGLSIFMFYFWGSYMSGEMKGANRRGRQLTTMLGSGYVQGLLVMVGAFVFIHTAGYDFFAAANSGAYGVSVSPYYNFFAAVVSGSPLLSVIMGVTFLGFLFPGLYINSSLVQRSLFAWSFDGILPRRLSSVSERTRTPVVAISVIALLGSICCVWVIYGSNVGQVLVVTAVLLVPPVLVTGIAGLLLPIRQPHLYRNGPADWRVAGVPVLPITSAATIVLSLVWGGLIMYFHAALGVRGAWTMPLTLLACGVVAVVWYLVANAVQRGRGVELKYVYNTIPPE
jgi:amino acid transporter